MVSASICFISQSCCFRSICSRSTSNACRRRRLTSSSPPSGTMTPLCSSRRLPAVLHRTLLQMHFLEHSLECFRDPHVVSITGASLFVPILSSSLRPLCHPVGTSVLLLAACSPVSPSPPAPLLVSSAPLLARSSTVYELRCLCIGHPSSPSRLLQCTK